MALTGIPLILRCQEIDDIAQLAFDREFVQALAEVGERANAYAFKSRFKGRYGIEKKVNRKRQESRRILAECRQAQRASEVRRTEFIKLPEIDARRREAERLRGYDPDHVTDAFGCRYVTLFQSEIPTTVEAVLAQLEQMNHANSPIRMVEAVIYTNRHLNDPLSIVPATDDVFSRSALTRASPVIRPPENRKSAYSSVHCVFERRVQIARPGHPPRSENAFFEIQFRDIFEEGWGEVHHNLWYSAKDDALARRILAADSTSHWAAHLNALKTFVDGCSQHASIIKNNLDALRGADGRSNTTQSVSVRAEDSKKVGVALFAAGARNEVIQNVTEAYTLLVAADEAQGRAEAFANYRTAAAAFEKTLAALTETQLQAMVDPHSHGVAEFYLRIELANCKFLVTDDQYITAPGIAPEDRLNDEQRRELLDEAMEIYVALAARQPGDPSPRYRQAKVLERLTADPARWVQVADRLNEAIGLADADGSTGPNHWLPIVARLEAAIAYWRQSETVEDAAGRLALLERAVELSMAAYQRWKRQPEVARRRKANQLGAHRAAAGILYYVQAIMQLGLASAYGASTLREFIQILNGVKIDDYNEFYKTRDSLMLAHDALDERRVAVRHAATTFNELRSTAEERAGHPLNTDQVQRYLRGAEAVCFDRAHRLLFEGATGGGGRALSAPP